MTWILNTRSSLSPTDISPWCYLMTKPPWFFSIILKALFLYLCPLFPYSNSITSIFLTYMTIQLTCSPQSWLSVEQWLGETLSHDRWACQWHSDHPHWASSLEPWHCSMVPKHLPQTVHPYVQPCGMWKCHKLNLQNSSRFLTTINRGQQFTHAINIQR